ncbi:MAG TPA: hypothetical protein VJO35_18730 [Terriglobales bacterium]|nr:hypothetical protein [Terriglobales bacterium]
MKTAVTLLIVCAATLLNAQAPARNHVRRIYVDEFSVNTNAEGTSLVRSKIISSLVEACGSNCAVVEAIGPSGDNGQDTADAILTGTIRVDTADGRHYRVQGAMRLVDKDGSVLWAGNVYSSPFARSATSSFADNTAKKLASFLAVQ